MAHLGQHKMFHVVPSARYNYQELVTHIQYTLSGEIRSHVVFAELLKNERLTFRVS